MSPNPHLQTKTAPLSLSFISQLKNNAIRVGFCVAQWFDTNGGKSAPDAPVNAANAIRAAHHIEWPRLIPFFGLHIACLFVFQVGVSAFAAGTAAALYLIRMFAITGFYHRYFSHRAFKASRRTQFVFAFIAGMAGQRGPLWWASQHRHHHVHADDEYDVHSPRHRGLWWSHMGWFMVRENFATRLALVPEWAKYPELRLLDRVDMLAPAALGLVLWGCGSLLAVFAPGLGTNGPQLVVWGLCISTVALYHATFAINSCAHRFGWRRYATRDDSRNNLALALLTLGEGWHNNHHHFPGSARQGFFWWEIDVTYYVLRVLAAVGIVRDLKPVPKVMLGARRIGRPSRAKAATQVGAQSTEDAGSDSMPPADPAIALVVAKDLIPPVGGMEVSYASRS